MLNKKQSRENLRQVRRLLGDQLTALRKAKNLTISEMCLQTGVSSTKLELLEIGKSELNFGLLNYLAVFFDKKSKLNLRIESLS